MMNLYALSVHMLVQVDCEQVDDGPLCVVCPYACTGRHCIRVCLSVCFYWYYIDACTCQSVYHLHCIEVGILNVCIRLSVCMCYFLGINYLLYR